MGAPILEGTRFYERQRKGRKDKWFRISSLMPETALVPAKKMFKKTPDLATLDGLKQRIQETFLVGKKKIDHLKVQVYWDTGWFLSEHILLNQNRADYGEQTIIKIAEALDVSETVLKDCRRFREKFPDLFPEPIRRSWAESGPTPPKVTKNNRKLLLWSHYRTLLVIGNDPLRFRLAAESAEKDWTNERLENEIRRRHQKLEFEKAGHSKRPKLKPVQGELYTYSVIRKQGRLAVDRGFKFFWRLSPRQSKGFQEGDILRKFPAGPFQKLKKADKNKLYTYEADVNRVVDGDTLWMTIYLEGRSAPPLREEKLRLRGVDAPELDTAEGVAAKRFVQRQIADSKKILITTTKPDKWDRYLTDIFLYKEDGRVVFLNQRLLDTGHAILKTTYSPYDWEDF